MSIEPNFFPKLTLSQLNPIKPTNELKGVLWGVPKRSFSKNKLFDKNIFVAG